MHLIGKVWVIVEDGIFENIFMCNSVLWLTNEGNCDESMSGLFGFNESSYKIHHHWTRILFDDLLSES